MKKHTTLGILGSIVLLGTLASCSGLKLGSNESLGNGNSNNLTVSQKQNIEVLTSLKMVETINNVNNISNAYRGFNNQTTLSDDTILEILPTIDTLLNNGTVVSSTLEEVDTVYDGITYNYKETLTYKDSNLKDASYTLIYNKEHTFTEQDENETEETTILKGIAIISENERYSFTSLDKVETEGNEVEEERYLKISLTNNSYVMVEEEFEEERNKSESEFEYTFINNGRIELQYSISLESKLKFDEIEYEINDTEYEIKKTIVDGEEIYRVKLEKDDDYSKAIGVYKKVKLEDGSVTFIKI